MADGDIDKAIILFRECAGMSPGHASCRYNLGIALSLTDRCDEAIKHYESLLRRDPGYPGIYTAMGQAAFGSYLEHIAGAEASRKHMLDFLMRAVEQDPDDVDALFSLGNAYIAVGNAETALPWLKSALRIQPKSPAIYFTIAKAFKMLKKKPEASVMARKSMQLSSPDDPFWEDIKRLVCELQ
jgi:tetratricopeptide (TPR) repeat protein